MDALADFASSFWSLTLSVLPWLAIGIAAAAVIQTFVPQQWAARLLTGRHGLPVAIAAGAAMPGCSRTTMPIAMGLRGMPGQRLGNLTALIFVAPLLSPITIALTWSVLGWRMTAARVIASLLGAVLLGTLINRREQWFEPHPRMPPLAGASPELDSCQPTGERCAQPSAARRLSTTALALTRRVAPYFIAGMALAAAITALLPEDAIPDLLGGTGGVWAFALASVIGAPLYVCQGEEVPLTYAVLASGLGPGPALTFLMGSVGMCLPTVVMSRAILTPRVTNVYIPFWITFTITAGMAFQMLAG